MKKSYAKGTLWVLLSLFASALNDAIAKYLMEDQEYGPAQITFLRLLFMTIFSSLSLFYTQQINKTSTHYFKHIIRGVLFAAGMFLWTTGLQDTPMATATIIGLTTPFFGLALAPFFLKERSSLVLWIGVAGGLIGTLMTKDLQKGSVSWQPQFLILLGANLLFAVLDIANKKWVEKNRLGTAIFYSSCTATILMLPNLYGHWKMPDTHTALLAFLGLGCSSTLLTYSLLKGYSYTSLVSLAPIHYTEVLFSAMLGYLVFGERLCFQQLLGASVVIISLLCTIWASRKVLKD